MTHLQENQSGVDSYAWISFSVWNFIIELKIIRPIPELFNAWGADGRFSSHFGLCMSGQEYCTDYIKNLFLITNYLFFQLRNLFVNLLGVNDFPFAMKLDTVFLWYLFSKKVQAIFIIFQLMHIKLVTF